MYFPHTGSNTHSHSQHADRFTCPGDAHAYGITRYADAC